MPLFTVTIKSNGSTNEKDRLSRAIHAASIAAGCARAAQAAGLPTVEQAPPHRSEDGATRKPGLAIQMLGSRLHKFQEGLESPVGL